MTNLEMIAATKNALWNQLYTSWITTEIFSFPWWFSILFLIASYIIWWKLLNKSRLLELLLFGSLLAVMSAIIDTIADNLVLWQYLVKIFPFTPAFFPFHLTLAPIILMIVYQYTDNWYKYLIGTVFAAVIYCFVIAPLFVAIGEVQLLKWNHGYTFITFIVRAMIARWILILCKQIQCSYEGRSESLHRFTPLFQPTAKPLSDTKTDEEGGADK
jgi:hypothetical protein